MMDKSAGPAEAGADIKGPDLKAENLKIYAAQTRASADEYASYYAGMDASMAQKVAMCAAHLNPCGVTGDMGCGSGKGSYDLARLYPLSTVIGVDISREAVDHCRSNYQAHNLSYVLGDISEPVFPEEYLDAILNSSVFHHVTSFNGYDARVLDRLMDNQVKQLRRSHEDASRLSGDRQAKEKGRIIIRDFIIPDRPQNIIVDFPTFDGSETGDVTQLSTAALFEEFACTFVSSLYPDGRVPYTLLEPARQRFRRFLAPSRAVAEFVLRKDYRESVEQWKTELLEEYTFWTQAQTIHAMTSRGLRVLLSAEIHNPWILENRFEGKVFLQDITGEPLPHFPTNSIHVGQRVPENEGVDLREYHCEKADSFSFCGLRCFRNRETGQVHELVGRPNQTIDIAPWFEENGAIYIVVREGYPRPVLKAETGSPSVDGSYFAGYQAEPVSAILADGQVTLDEGLKTALRDRAGIAPEDIVSWDGEQRFFSSPGGMDELVIARDCRLNTREYNYEIPGNYSKLSTSGRVVAVEAGQILRACQVGSMMDNRVELNAYRILAREGYGLGPWIGWAIPLREQETGELAVQPSSHSFLTAQKEVFEEIPVAERPGFFDLCQGHFQELDLNGRVIHSIDLEYVTPRSFSDNTVSLVPAIRSGGRILVGLELRDLPVAQLHTGSARLPVIPAFRLERSVKDIPSAKIAAAHKFEKYFQGKVLGIYQLGSKYFSSSGCMKEAVYPMLVEVDAASALDSQLTWFYLDEILENTSEILDGHTITGLWRAGHALGVRR